MVYQTAAQKLEFNKVIQRLQHYCSSELGKEAAEHMVPITDVETLSCELNYVTELRSLLVTDRFPIHGLKDIRDILVQSGIENRVLSPSDFLAVFSTLSTTRFIKDFLQNHRAVAPNLSSLGDKLHPNKLLEFNISEAIDLNGQVKDTASKELRIVRGDIARAYTELRKQLERILRNFSEQGFTQDDIITTREGRLVIPVRAEQKHRVPGFIHSASSSGLTVFIEPAETLAMNNEVKELLFREQHEIEKILRRLTIQLGEIRAPLQENMGVLLHMDLLHAKAIYSLEIKGNKPLLKEKGSLKIIDARHPILLLHHPPEAVVPLTIELGGKYKTLLITGPNAGGKSVALKNVGILALMLQCGLHVPASPNSEFPMFEGIFVDIGDDQSIENDLSTFASHMINMKEILESAGERSLVLIDEIGAGTDPAEGGGLAAAILKSLTTGGALTIASTHQVSLKAFAHETEGIENGAMEFDQASLLPTYRFRTGVPGSSYAIEIAHRLGMPQGILTEAKTLIGEQKDRLERLVVDLEGRSQSLENELELLRVDRKKLNDLIQFNEGKLRELNSQVKSIKSKALEEAKTIVSKANSIIEHAVKEIRQRQAEKNAIRESKGNIQSLAGELREIERSLESLQEGARETIQKVRKGDLVKLKSGSQVGEVIAEPDNEGFTQIAFNSFKMRISIAEITKVARSERVELVGSAVQLLDKKITREVDVRGMFGDQAVETVDKFLDDAMLCGLESIDVIHGKGSGVLRKRISQFLSEDKRVKSHRLGEWNEGGAGVTIVELNT